jgi:predicted small integral membrane protein
MFTWMVWTTPVAVFFTCIALMLVGMTVWEIKSPTVERKGFLPMVTTRGDRLFIGLLGAAYINLAFIGLAGAGAQHLDLFRCVHGLAGTGGAQGLIASWSSVFGPLLPRGRDLSHTGEAHRSRRQT